ncbi:MAG: hypothetical protein HY868_13315 [Chloroflexi bacterium]|nr:hypothetical protein [Chloroflexota bacterium]
MIDIVHFRSWVFWWGALTASMFIQDWLNQIAAFFRAPDIFDKTKLPFSVIPGLNTWINDVATRIPQSVEFKPNQVILIAGPVKVEGWMLAILFGVLILLLAFRYYRHALRSSAWFDDFFAIFLVYLVLRIEENILAISSVPILSGVRDFLKNPTSAFVTLLILTLFLVFFGEGFRSKHAFWRAIAEITLVALVLYPGEAAGAIAWVIEGFANFGAYLGDSRNLNFAALWGLFGMGLALQRIFVPQPGETGGGGGGGGGGGEKGGKGGGGDGGGLKLKMPWKRA